MYMPRASVGGEYNEENAKNRANIAYKYGFTDIRYKLYHRTRTFTATEYTMLLGTYSDHIAIEETTRKKTITLFMPNSLESQKERHRKKKKDSVYRND